MSNNIDRNVVEMEFDNGRFEKNINQSMNSIDNLKQSLDFSGSNNSVSSIASNIQSLTDRFSTLGIIGMRVIQNLTDAGMKLASKTLSFITDGIISGGIKRAMNLENAHFQLQGLLKDEEAVADVMVNVNDAVDGTAYSLDAAAKVASQLAASGMTAGDDMFKSLRAVAGVAAMTNSTYEDIGDVFTKINGQGRVMADDLNRLASRGLNAAATLGESLGKTEAEVREMVTKGKIDFKTFALAMDDAFGEHAKAANKTFSGAMANVKSALARIGALFVSPIIAEESPAVQVLNAIRERINDVKKLVEPLANVVTTNINAKLSALAEVVKNFKVNPDSFQKFSDSVQRGFFAVLNLGKYLGSAFSNILSGLSSILKPIGEAFKEVFPMSLSYYIENIAKAIADLTSHFKLSEKASEGVRKAFKGIFSVLKGFGEAIAWAFNGIVSLVPEMGNLGEKLLDVAGGFGDALVSAKNFISDLPIIENLGNGVIAVFRGIVDALGKIGEFGGSIFKGIGEGLASIFSSGDAGFAINTTLLATFAYNLKNVFVQVRKLLGNVNPIQGFLNTLDQARDTLFQWEKNLNANYFMKIGGAILMLAAGLMILSTIPGDKLAAALGAMTVAVGELVGAMAILSGLTFTTGNIKASKTILKIAGALLIMAAAMKVLSSIDAEAMGVALIGMTVGLTEMIGAIAILSEIKMAGKAAKQLVKLSEALLIMSVALKIMGSIDNMIGALAGMAGVLTAILLFTETFSKIKMKGAGQILILSVALTVLAGALKIFATMGTEDMVRSVIAMATALGILVAALEFMTGGLAGAAAALILAVAINALVPAIVALGHLSLKQIGKGLLALVGAFAVFGGVAAILGPLAPVIITLAAAIGVIGLGVGAAAAGIAMLSAALVTLAAAGAAVPAAITAIIVAFINLIPAIAIAIADGIVAFVSALAENAGVLIESVTTLVSQIITSLTTLVPQFIELGTAMIMAFLASVKQCVPEIIETAVTCVLAFAEGLGRLIPEMVRIAGESIVAFLNAISETLPDIINAGYELMIAFIEGLAETMENNKERLSAAIWSLFRAIIDTAIEVLFGAFPTFEQMGEDLIHSNFVQGIIATAGEIWDSICEGVQDALDGVSDFIGSFWDVGVDIVEGLAGGIKSMAESVAKTAKDVARGAWEAAKNFLDINSPSRKFISLGKSCDEGLIVGAEKLAGKVNKTFVGVSEDALNAMGDSLSKVPSLLQNGVDLNPSITPIMDLSNVQEGAKSIGSMLDNMKSFSIAADVSANTKRGSTNSDVVDAVNRLNKKLDNVGGTTNYTTIDGVSYGDGTEVSDAVGALVRAIRIEGRS